MSHYEDQRNEDNEVASTLNARGKNYGSFNNQAQLSQGLKNAIVQHYYNTHGQAEAPPMSPVVTEAISMICHKLARIANGEPHYIDSWRDIGGYSQLVVEALGTTEGATDTKTTPIAFKEGSWG